MIRTTNPKEVDADIEKTKNPFILAGFNAIQATQLYEFASKYEDVGINADEASQMIINATRSSVKLRSELEKIGDSVVTKEHIKTQIEEWFCDANTEDNMFAVAELYALLYSEAKRNLRYWADTYVEAAVDE